MPKFNRKDIFRPLDQKKPRSRSKSRPSYRQGIFKLLPESKCTNTDPVEYRSQLEFNFFHKLERSKNVIRWSSETIKVPYFNPIRSREEGRPVKNNYYVDLLVETKNMGTLLVEIKPEKEIKAIQENIKPKRTKRKKETTYKYEMKMWEINKAKWEQAKKFANVRGWTFLCVSEKDLKDGVVPFL